ncbi:MAG: ROK family protein [Halobacteriaceae archaeon]
MYVGVDLGATHLRTAIADADTTVATHSTATPTDDGDAVADAICTAVTTVCEAADIAPSAVTAVGAATIGPVRRGRVHAPPNLPAIASIPIVGPLETLTNAPVTHRNDAIAGLIGERRAGAPPDTVYLTMSTGIGAGACVDGHVLTGHAGNAAEVGHLTVDHADTLTCGCGATGHWEAYCGGANIPAHAAHLHASTDLDTTIPLETAVDAATILAAEDPLTDRLRDRIAEYTTRGLATITHAYAPETIIVGGAVARNHPESLIAPARDRLPDRVVTDAPRVTLTTLDNPVLAGAIALARDTDPGHTT